MLGYDTVEEAVGNRTRIDIAPASDVRGFRRGGGIRGTCILNADDGHRNDRTARKAIRRGVCPPGENRFHAALHEPLSTFALEADGASYANCRRILASGALPKRTPCASRSSSTISTTTIPHPKGGAAVAPGRGGALPVGRRTPSGPHRAEGPRGGRCGAAARRILSI